MKLSTIIPTISIITFAAACGTDRSTAPDPSGKPSAGAPTGPAIVSQSSAISECGGFDGAAPDATLGQSAASNHEDGYCDAERLRWSFDASSRTLELRNDRVVLNCCGDRTIKVSQQGSTFVINETDAPKDGGGRCRCMCTYDYSVSVKLGPSVSGKIAFKLVREITDGEVDGLEHSGTIDLDAGSGSEVIDSSDVSPWCNADARQQPAPATEQLVHEDQLSECGGFEAKQSTFAPNDGGSSYCDAEVLAWSYDAASKKLRLSDNRALLNCCGERTISVTKQGDTYVVTQLDAPEDGGRCQCMCVFDLATTISGVNDASGSIKVRLIREVRDLAGTSTASILFDGELAAANGSGSELLDDTDAEPWCEN